MGISVVRHLGFNDANVVVVRQLDCRHLPLASSHRVDLVVLAVNSPNGEVILKVKGGSWVQVLLCWVVLGLHNVFDPVKTLEFVYGRHLRKASWGRHRLRGRVPYGPANFSTMTLFPPTCSTSFKMIFIHCSMLSRISCLLQVHCQRDALWPSSPIEFKGFFMDC